MRLWAPWTIDSGSLRELVFIFSSNQKSEQIRGGERVDLRSGSYRNPREVPNIEDKRLFKFLGEPERNGGTFLLWNVCCSEKVWSTNKCEVKETSFDCVRQSWCDIVFIMPFFAQSTDTDLDEMTIMQLRNACKQKGVNPTSWNRNKLIELLRDG